MAAAAAITTISCFNLGESDDERFYGYFLRDAKAMEDVGLPVYWLGREVNAGGRTFQGPYGLEFGGEVEGGGIFVRYISWFEGTPGEGASTSLDMTVYSPGAWELVESGILNPRLLPSEGEATRRTVTVSGREAKLISVPQYARPVGELRLILDLDDVVVVAVAPSGGQRPGGGDYNPFINNPDLLVQIIDENLRPYPE